MTPIRQTRLRPIPLLAWLLPLLAALSPSAFAQPGPDDTTRAAARELAAQGIEAYQAANYPEANRKLEKAYKLFATPTLGLWSARARMQLGQWVEAAERYREAQRVSAAVGDSAMQQQAQKEASEELSALMPRMPAVTIELEGSAEEGVSLTLDGAALSSELFGVRLPVNPGAHRVVAIRGSERAEVELRLAEKEHKRVPLRLSAPVAQAAQTTPAQPALPAVPAKPEEAPAPAPTPTQVAAHSGVAATLTPTSDMQPRDKAPALLRPLAITALALGGVGLATSGVTALMALGKCSGGDCATQAAKDKYDSLVTVSTVTGWAGAAFAAGGLAMWLVAPKREQAPEAGEVSWAVGPLGVDVRGKF